ncbi:Reverse transcriptase/endonuclease, partial [Giardia duodenalis]
VGVIQPRQMDAYYNEKVKKYRDGTLPIIYGTDGSLHPSPRGTSRSPLSMALRYL